MDERYRCRECLLGQAGDERCVECGAEEFIDAESEEQRQGIVDEVRRRAVQRRDKFYLLMKVFVIAVSAAVLLVGLTITHALGGGALDWAVKLLAVALLATAWKAIPQVYYRYFRGRSAVLYAKWAEDES